MLNQYYKKIIISIIFILVTVFITAAFYIEKKSNSAPLTPPANDSTGSAGAQAGWGQQQ